MREFAQELPHTTAAEAWQRSVFVTGETLVNPEAEPRVSGTTRDAPQKAMHPFFWSGFMLVDTGAPPDKGEVAEETGPLSRFMAPCKQQPSNELPANGEILLTRPAAVVKIVLFMTALPAF